jgi:predicted RNA-binding Zn-ribbon protein involved in translation (DUF1610 family)
MKKMKKIPNCALCNWAIPVKVNEWICTAQGGGLAWRVYNSRRCRQLYREKRPNA